MSNNFKADVRKRVLEHHNASVSLLLPRFNLQLSHLSRKYPKFQNFGILGLASFIRLSSRLYLAF
jgi:hypothetical protein